MPTLFDPITFGNVTLPNRITVSPMCQYSSEDGFANDWHLVHMGSRAAGGAGLVILEASAVSPQGRITPADLGIYKDEHVAFLKRITDFISSQGSVPGIQLAHAGRKASCAIPWQGGAQLAPEQGGWQTLAPSSKPFRPEDRAPVALSLAQIQQVKEDFVKAAKRALEAGFKVIEVHGAHGYLLHEFYSPLSNERTDDYGGSRDNRCRLLVEVVESVRAVLPEGFPLFVRISSTDWVPEGWSDDDSVYLAKKLLAAKADLIDCSSGGNVQAKIPVGPGYQVPFAAKLRAEAGIATGAVGLITEAKQADNIIREGKADLVIMARQMLREPYFALHAAAQLNSQVRWPQQYHLAH
jgi:2,4-dienoyl-CoA reductase-like NADH-dependent reductase (Old Yellow Enzyme family)